MTSIEKVYRILELLRRHYRTGLTNKEISNRLRIPASTCYRIMKSLKRFDFVSQSKVDKRYFLGFCHLRYADALVGGMDVSGLCLPLLESVHERTGETTMLALFSGQHAIVIEICGSIDMLTSVARGEIMPMHCTASGKAILAFLPPETKRSIMQSLDYHVFTEWTITDPARLERELEEVRRTGIAFNLREFHPDTAALAVPIFNRQNAVNGSLSIVSLVDRQDTSRRREYSRLLRSAGFEVTRELGGRYPQVAGPES